MTGRNPPRMNETALQVVLRDVQFIEAEIKRLERPELDHVFDEVRLVSRTWGNFVYGLICTQTINIILTDAISAYMESSIRSMSYASIRPLRLAVVLAKLSKGAAAIGGPAMSAKAERRRKEADEVAKLANAR